MDVQESSRPGRAHRNKALPSQLDAVVVGAGPNGLSAAITLARAGRTVRVLEARDTVGGGARSAELTLPGFVHDVCSAIYPLGIGSPFFASLPLGDHGLEWVQPDAPLAHPFDDGSAVILERGTEATGCSFDDTRDARSYCKLMDPLIAGWSRLAPDLLAPFHVPRHPLLMAGFSRWGMRSARRLIEARFRGPKARALFAGLAAHSMLSLDQPLAAAFGLVLGAAGHAVGWPLVRGGSGRLTEALASYLRSLGGEIVVRQPVRSMRDLPSAKAYLFNVTPRQILGIAGDRLPGRYRRRLERFRYGPGVYKVDWALRGPIPWRAPACRRAATVHLGPTYESIEASENAVTAGRVSEGPFVLVVQQSLFDPTRAPEGHHTGWAYCHVPNGSTADLTELIEIHVERFAPGFRDRILARHTADPAAMERYNANYVGGDINGGTVDLGQFFARPAGLWAPYATPDPHIFLCSSSTPPSGGVHGMCGYHAAQAALRGALK